MDTRTSSRTSAVVAIIAAVLAVLWEPAAAAPGDITEYPLPEANSEPGEIAAGPDGNMWFTEAEGNKIGRITPDGGITEYRVPTKDSSPAGIAAGPDGNMWFTEWLGYRIGRITPRGRITEYRVPTKDSSPSGIAAGPDGNMWFTEWLGYRIGRITPRGRITEYPLEVSVSPGGIAAGPDGNMWFTEGTRIGRITPGGTITEFSSPNNTGRYAYRITAGPDGNMWFNGAAGRDYYNSGIGLITPEGTITEYGIEWPRRPGDIAAGPDGNMWFTEGGGIGRITQGGRFLAKFPLPTAPTRSEAKGIAAGPDGSMWFTQITWSRYVRHVVVGSAIGRISPTATPRVLKKACPVNVTLHKSVPTKVGNRILTDKITTNTTSCHLLKPVVLCRPLASTTVGKKASCDTKVTKRGKIRVNTKRYEAMRVTVVVRAKPKPGHADSWKANTWRKPWVLK